MTLAQILRADQCTRPSNARSCRSSESEIYKKRRLLRRSLSLPRYRSISLSVSRLASEGRLQDSVHCLYTHGPGCGERAAGGEQDPRERVRQAHTALNTLCENCNEAYVWAETRRAGRLAHCAAGQWAHCIFGWLVAWRCEDVDRSKRRCVSYFLSD